MPQTQITGEHIHIDELEVRDTVVVDLPSSPSRTNTGVVIFIESNKYLVIAYDRNWDNDNAVCTAGKIVFDRRSSFSSCSVKKIGTLTVEEMLVHPNQFVRELGKTGKGRRHGT